MGARTFLVIFEGSGYNGPPLSTTFTDPYTNAQCSGIQVAENTLGWNRGTTGFSFRVCCRFWIYDQDTGPLLSTLGGIRHSQIGDPTATSYCRGLHRGYSDPEAATASSTIADRKWGTNGPVDNNLESDWKGSLVNTFCGPTQ